MKLLIAAAVLLATLASCNKPDTPSTRQSDAPADAPACIQQRIQTILSEPVRNPPASVWRYTYNGQTVYYIPPYCCDHYGDLYDDKCNLICHPDGGITGGGDGGCKDFFSARTDGVEIWRDQR